MHLEQSPKAWKVGWKSQKLGDKLKPSRLKHCWGWPEYWEESLWPEEIYCHSASSERPSANADVKNLQGIIIITIIKWRQNEESNGSNSSVFPKSHD